jgi:non-homologous end joining protein Ku
MVGNRETIIERRTGAFDPASFRDRHQDELVAAKMKGLATTPRRQRALLLPVSGGRDETDVAVAKPVASTAPKRRKVALSYTDSRPQTAVKRQGFESCAVWCSSAEFPIDIFL